MQRSTGLVNVNLDQTLLFFAANEPESFRDKCPTSIVNCDFPVVEPALPLTGDGNRVTPTKPNSSPTNHTEARLSCSSHASAESEPSTGRRKSNENMRHRRRTLYIRALDAASSASFTQPAMWQPKSLGSKRAEDIMAEQLAQGASGPESAPAPLWTRSRQLSGLQDADQASEGSREVSSASSLAGSFISQGVCESILSHGSPRSDRRPSDRSLLNMVVSPSSTDRSVSNQSGSFRRGLDRATEFDRWMRWCLVVTCLLTSLVILATHDPTLASGRRRNSSRFAL